MHIIFFSVSIFFSLNIYTVFKQDIKINYTIILISTFYFFRILIACLVMFFDASLYQVGYHVCLFQVREELFQGFKRIMDINKDDINEDYNSSAKIVASTENPIHDKENPKMKETNIKYKNSSSSLILKNKFRNLIRSGFHLPPIGSSNENDAVLGDSIGPRGSSVTELTVRNRN